MKPRNPFAVFDIGTEGRPVIVALHRDESGALAHAAQLERDRLECSGVRFPLERRFYRRATSAETSAGLAAGLRILS